MNHFLRNTRCPKCAEQGNDRSGNNLAIYSDTHKYCFACGYYEKGDIVEKYKQKLVPKTSSSFFTPALTFDDKALLYLKKYGLTDKEIEDNYFWDETGFLVFNANVFQNARNFNNTFPKYISRGTIRGNEVIFHKSKNYVIIVEDSVSAIKVGRVCSSVAIHNSVIPHELLMRLSKDYDNLGIWLDPDKQKEMLGESKKAAIYFNNVKVIWTDKDPKDFTTKEITQILFDKGISV